MPSLPVIYLHFKQNDTLQICFNRSINSIFIVIKQKRSIMDQMASVSINKPHNRVLKSKKVLKMSKRDLKQHILRKIGKRQIVSRSGEQSSVREISSKCQAEPNLTEFVTEQNLKCPICLEWCVLPVLTKCGHYYCLSCFDEFLAFSSKCCCICRTSFRADQCKQSNFLRNLFEDYISRRIDWIEAQIYWARVNQVQKSQSERSIEKNIRVGELVDIHRNREWIEGKILLVQSQTLSVEIIEPNNIPTSKVIHVPRDSREIARHRAFTEQKQIKQKIIPFRTFPVPIYIPAPVRTDESQRALHENIRNRGWDEDMIAHSLIQSPQSWINQEFSRQLPSVWAVHDEDSGTDILFI